MPMALRARKERARAFELLRERGAAAGFVESLMARLSPLSQTGRLPSLSRST